MGKQLEIFIRELEREDLEAYLYLNHPDREFHKFNGPYYGRSNEEELKKYVDGLKVLFLQGEKNVLRNIKMIVNKDSNELIGQVNWYWKSEETFWMEVGIIIFNESYWGMGLGYKALKMWINEVFRENPELVRIGLSTWSGNERMMKLAEKLGMVKEAVYKKARIVNNEYYDALSYGILRLNWNAD
ncbi:MAG: GNAT family N-acetyltransferase [Clostridium sp.]